MLVLLGVVAAACVAAYAAVLLVAWLAGGSLEGGLVRVGEFAGWLVTLVQILGQVSRAAAAAVPPFLAPVYEGAAAFLLSSSALPSECLTWLRPFSMQLALFAVVLALLAVSLGLVFLNTNWEHAASKQVLQRQAAVAASGSSLPSAVARAGAVPVLLGLLFFALRLLYPQSANAALQLVNCVPKTDALLAVAALDGGAEVAAGYVGASNATQVTVSVLASQPGYVCYRGSHAASGALAWVILALFIVGYPLATLAWVLVAAPSLAPALSSACRCCVLTRCWSRSIATRSAELHSLQPQQPTDAVLSFLGSTYASSAWAFQHADMALLASLAAVGSLWLSPASVASSAGKASVTCLLLATAGVALLLHPAPYLASHGWRRPVRVYALGLGSLAAVFNGVQGAAALQGGPGQSSQAVLVLAGLVTALAACFVVLLVLVLFATTVRGARREQVQLQQQQRDEWDEAAAASKMGAVASGGPSKLLQPPPLPPLASCARLIALLRDTRALWSRPWPWRTAVSGLASTRPFGGERTLRRRIQPPSRAASSADKLPRALSSDTAPEVGIDVSARRRLYVRRRSEASVAPLNSSQLQRTTASAAPAVSGHAVVGPSGNGAEAGGPVFNARAQRFSWAGMRRASALALGPAASGAGRVRPEVLLQLASLHPRAESQPQPPLRPLPQQQSQKQQRGSWSHTPVLNPMMVRLAEAKPSPAPPRRLSTSHAREPQRASGHTVPRDSLVLGVSKAAPAPALLLSSLPGSRDSPLRSAAGLRGSLVTHALPPTAARHRTATASTTG